MSDGSSKRYPLELRERAVRMVAEISDQDKSEWTAITEVAGLLGVGTAETVRRWVGQAQVDAVAMALNNRPRKTLNWRTPAEALNEHLYRFNQPVLRRPIEPGQCTTLVMKTSSLVRRSTRQRASSRMSPQPPSKRTCVSMHLLQRLWPTITTDDRNGPRPGAAWVSPSLFIPGQNVRP